MSAARDGSGCRGRYEHLFIRVGTVRKSLRPRRSSLVTTSTSPPSRRSRRRVNPRRCEVATLPEIVLVATSRGLTLRLLPRSPELVARCLAGGGDAEVGEGARHRRIRPKGLSGTCFLPKTPHSYFLNRPPETARNRSDTVGEVLRP